MSTFGGKIEEIPYISVDRFNGENLKSEAYFLSHCHSDHMNGLSYDFFNHLIENGKFFYASEISCRILSNMFPTCVNNLKELSVHTPETINETLSVTTISAGHCPGSVMFLFVTNSKRILYTGDYRINKNDIRKMKQFYNSFKQVLMVDKIYLDTTFFSKSYLRFPKRTDSVKEVCRIIKNHVAHDKHTIHITGGARYAYEYVFSEIYNKLKLPVHVGEIEYNFYKLIPELDFAITMDGSKTPIHYNCLAYKKVCNFTLDTVLLKLNTTAWRWKTNLLENGLSYYDGVAYQVCFSTHASLEEGVELIRFLKPKAIEICVKHDNEEINEEISNLIDELLNEIHPPKTFSSGQRLFKTNIKVKRKKRKKRNDSEHLLSILDSPPRENKPSHSLLSPEKTKSPTKILSTPKTEYDSPVASTSNFNNAEESAEIAKCNNMSLEKLNIDSESQSENVLLSIIEDGPYNIENNITENIEAEEEDSSTSHNSGPNVILSLFDSEEHKDNSDINSGLDTTSRNVLMDIIDLDTMIS